MKTNFTFEDESLNRQFEQLTPNDLRMMTKDFLSDYGSSRVFLARKIDLNPQVVQKWLSGKETLGTRSLKRIFSYLHENYPKWQEYLELQED